MLLYIAIILSLILVTQVIRVTQNGINLYRNSKIVDREVERLGGVSNEDLETQKEAYRLIVRHFKIKDCVLIEEERGKNNVQSL